MADLNNMFTNRADVSDLGQAWGVGTTRVAFSVGPESGTSYTLGFGVQPTTQAVTNDIDVAGPSKALKL